MSLGEIWPRIGPDKSHEILSSIQKSNKKLYGTTVEVLAPRLKLRPAKILEMPKAERHARWMNLLAHPQYDPLTQNLLMEWLANHQTALMAHWLDRLGATHDGRGLLKDYPPCPDEAVLDAAWESLLQAHAPDEVLAYLSLFNAAPETRWPALAARLATDPRLPLRPLASP